jgi:hypothetical protein
MNPKVPFSIEITADYSVKPPMAILREQGVNGEVEMAAAGGLVQRRVLAANPRATSTL